MKQLLALSCCLIFLLQITGFSQPPKEELKQTILHRDSLFWVAYNNCDTGGMKEYLNTDMEFYHDKGGITKGSDNLLAVSKKNLCSNVNMRIRREEVKGSVKAFLMNSNDSVYGVVLKGEHLFYVLETGKKERLDGLAQFFHLWTIQDGKWKMSRIFSYDHGPAPYVNQRKEIVVAPAVLNHYCGKYKGAQSGSIQVQRDNGVLNLLIGDNKYVLHPGADRIFFSMDRDLEFEFIENAHKDVTKMVVKENGTIVEEAEVIK